MAVGQVSFHDDRKVCLLYIKVHHYCQRDGTFYLLILTLTLMSSQVKRVLVPQRENPIINRLNKTKVEKHPDLRLEKEDRLKELRKRDQAAQQSRVSSLLLMTSFPTSWTYLAGGFRFRVKD